MGWALGLDLGLIKGLGAHNGLVWGPNPTINGPWVGLE